MATGEDEDHERAAPRTQQRPRWSMKVIALGLGGLALIGGAVGGAAQGAVQDWLQPKFTGAINSITEGGDPVVAHTVLRPRQGDMWLPAPATLDQEFTDNIGFVEPEGQRIELEKQGAYMFGDRELELTLIGNRADGVRITDLRPISDCSDFGQGTLLQLVPHGGGAPSTHRIFVNVEDPDQAPLGYDASKPGMSEEPFFDGTTLTLDKNEEEFVLVRLQAHTQYCDFDLELTVQGDGGDVVKQRLFGEGNEPSIAPHNYAMVQDDLEITSSFVGGGLCDGPYQSVPPDENGGYTAYGCVPQEVGPVPEPG